MDAGGVFTNPLETLIKEFLTKIKETNGKKIEITNRSWWEYIFEHGVYKFSFDEMKDNYNYNAE